MTLTIDGVLREADHKSHVLHAFDVPQGVGRLVGRFRHAPHRATGALFDNLLTLSLFGPDGARGVRHNNPQLDFAIGADHATPGYTRGPIEPGRWTIAIDTFRVLGPDPVRYAIEIDFEAAAPSHAPRPSRSPPRDTGPGWYRGDLHAHSLHSDATWDIPDLIGWAGRRGLDFVTLTDHNTVSGHEEALALGDDGLLVMGGTELTTHYGHALALGRREWQEWRTGPVTGLTMPDIAAQAMASGATFVIAHPCSPGDPACTGCRWEFDDMRPGNAGLVEIWNGGPWADYNEEGLALYRAWLDAGHRLRATAGTDIHGAHDDTLLMGFNHVHAAARSEAAILDAVRRGENYLSSGPTLIATAADAKGTVTPMGGTTTRDAVLTVRWSDAGPGLALRVLTGGTRPLQEESVEAEGVRKIPLRGAETWVMAELRDGDGALRAVTNPVFVAEG